MLRKKGLPSERAIDYLALMSRLTAEDYVGECRSIQINDVAAFRNHYATVIAAIERLEDTIMSLVVLDREEVQRAAATAVVRHIMNKSLARPFVVALLLVDFVLHLTLILVSVTWAHGDSYYCNLSSILQWQAFRSEVSIAPEGSTLGDFHTYVVFLVCTLYLVRKACEAISLLSISMSVFRHSVTNVWTFVDTSAIALTMVALRYAQIRKSGRGNG